MPDDFVIARNTEPGSTLPYLLRVPLRDGIILKATRAPAPPSPAHVRRWASAHDIVVSDRGRIPVAVMDQYLEARARGET